MMQLSKPSNRNNINRNILSCIVFALVVSCVLFCAMVILSVVDDRKNNIW